MSKLRFYNNGRWTGNVPPPAPKIMPLREQERTQGFNRTEIASIAEDEAQYTMDQHERKYHHWLLHDSKKLGLLELDEDTIGEGKIFQVQGGKIVCIQMPTPKPERRQGYSTGNNVSNPKLNWTVITSSLTLSQDNSLVLVNAASGNIVVTLPSANAFNNFQFYLKRIDSSSNTVTVAVTGSDTVDGQTTDQLPNQYSARHYASANDLWHIISS